MQDGTKVISGGADKAARVFDVQTGQMSQVAQHDEPIKCLRWIDMQGGLLATGSWDKVRFWGEDGGRGADGGCRRSSTGI